MTTSATSRTNIGAGIGRTCNHRLTHALATIIVLAAAMTLSGCLITAATVGVIHVARSGGGGETATVTLESPPQEVYQVMLSVIRADPALTLVDKNDTKMTVSVSKGQETATGSVKSSGDQGSKLTMKAKSPDGRDASSDLARRAVTRICAELGVSYQMDVEP